MGKLGWVVSSAAAATALAIGCSTTYGDDGQGALGDGGAGVQDDAEAVDDANDESILPVDDGGLSPDAGPGTSPCTPAQVFIPVTGANGTACNQNSLLVGMPPPAGLEYGCTNSKAGTLGGQTVSSCIAVTFTKSLAAIVVRAAAGAKACDTACTGTSCGTGDKAGVFVSAGGAFVSAGALALTPGQSDYAVPIPASVIDAKQVAVCRLAYSCARDDVLVASIRGTCKD